MPSTLPYLAVLPLVLACASRQEIAPDPRHAYAHASCAPWDGGAVRIVLSEESDTLRVLQGPPRPGLELAAYTGIHEALGREFQVNAEGRSGDAATGGAVRCDERGECASATGGVIRLTRMEPDSTLVGSYDVSFPGAEPVSGRFAARWLAARVLCG